MVAFVAQVKKWLKKDGVFFVGYQEGDIMPKTENSETTVFAKAIKKNDMKFEVCDITKQTYELLEMKRKVAIANKAGFEAEGYMEWFDMLIAQTDCIMEPFEYFKEKMARYIYTVGK